jgi:hypothetical protein
VDLVIPVDVVTGGSMMQKPNNSEKDGWIAGERQTRELTDHLVIQAQDLDEILD